MERDEKGKFSSTKKANETNNTTNTKENKTMKTARELRMEKLATQGIGTDGFFTIDVNETIPAGSKIKVMIEKSKELTPEQKEAYKLLVDTGVISESDVNFENVREMANGIDPVAQKIASDGYVQNSKLFRRWILAQTMHMMNYKRFYLDGWEVCLEEKYSYTYQFTMLVDELKVLSKLEKEDPVLFEERVHFFNKDVVFDLLLDYKKKLNSFIMSQPTRKCKGKEYVRLSRFGNIFKNDLDAKVFNDIDVCKQAIVLSSNYTEIYNTFDLFVKKYYNKLPFETKKCKEWKDAFKGSGAYYSLQNMVRFHNVKLSIYDRSNIYRHGVILQTVKENETYLTACLKAYDGELWRFNAMLKKAIKDNNFNLAESIERNK